MQEIKEGQIWIWKEEIKFFIVRKRIYSVTQLGGWEMIRKQPDGEVFLMVGSTEGMNTNINSGLLKLFREY